MNESYEDILTSMQNKFYELAGYNADEASDIGIRLRVLAGELFAINSNISWLNNQMFPQSATNTQLDYHATQRGIKRKEATKATGELTFSVASPLSYDVDIPINTICATSSDDNIRYQTTQATKIVAGNLSVSVPAEAEIGGSNGNCLQNLITIMVTPPPGIYSVTNETEFVGGKDSEDDNSLRKRLFDNYANVSNGTNCAFYRQEVLKNNKVTSVSVISRPRGIGSVDVYIWSISGNPSEALIQEVTETLSEIKEINVDLSVKAPTELLCEIKINIVCEEGFDFDTLKLSVEATIRNYVAQLGIGERLYISRLGEKILSIPGVISYSPNSTDTKPSPTQIVAISEIDIRKGS